MNTARLTSLSSFREAPEHLVRDLRAIDSTAELYYVENGIWWLGSVRPNMDRKKTALHLLGVEAKKMKPRRHIVQQALLLLEGFALVQQYEIQGEPDRRIVADFEYRDWLWRSHREPELLKKFLDVASDDQREEARDAMFREKIRADGRYLFNRLVRRNPRIAVAANVVNNN